jgi:cell filamentation protein
MSAHDRHRIEADCTYARILELRENPVSGNFDVAHLKEINRRIFQDLPAHGYNDVTPGQFRPAVPSGYDWIKERQLEHIDGRTCVSYSPMDKSARNRLDEVLEKADPKELSKLGMDEFSREIGNLYVELDYIHPFPDGNSRTLREFTRELAEASGYRIHWERFSQSPIGRDKLCIARDLSVNTLALPHVRDEGTKRAIFFTLDQFGGNPNLLIAADPHHAGTPFLLVVTWKKVLPDEPVRHLKIRDARKRQFLRQPVLERLFKQSVGGRNKSP